MKIQLEGKRALITGGSRGIGLEIARSFLEHGATVAIASRKQENLEEALGSLARDGFSAVTIAQHVGRPGAAESLVKAAVLALGGLDIVVNNAATNPQFGPLVSADEALFEKTFETNVKAYFSIAKEAAKVMSAAGTRGALLFVSSTQGLTASPAMGLYGMSKAAVISLTKTLAVELGSLGIRANALAPGLVETRFAAALTGDETVRERYCRRAALGRFGRPEEIAGAAVFLCSDAASFITGETLVIDGGFTVSA